MGHKHNLFRDHYHTTHQHDGASAVYGGWGQHAVLICMCTEQADAEVIVALLNKWKDIISMFRCVETAWQDARRGCNATERSTMLWQLNGMLGSMHETCLNIMQSVHNAWNFDAEDREDVQAAFESGWQEARTMAGMAHGNRGLADHGGLEIDDRYGHHEEE